MPLTRVYRPEGCALPAEDGIVLFVDEFEAIRLADFSGLYHEDAARKMNISRQTFGRIISSARNKVADALINGKVLKIEGGSISLEHASRCVCNSCRKSTECPHRFREDGCPRLETGKREKTGNRRK